MPETMRAMQVPEQGAAFELVEREVPQPTRGEVLVKVEACGVCHSDVFAKEGGYPGSRSRSSPAMRSPARSRRSATASRDGKWASASASAGSAATAATAKRAAAAI